MRACAFLRVYQPLDALPEDERAHWERYIVQGRHNEPIVPVYRQRYVEPGGRLGVLTSEDERADVRLVDGDWYVCPWRTRLRVLAGLLALRDTAPSEVADALVPEAEARRAARELARIKRRDPGAIPTMLQSPWHVPVRWFTLFADADRRLVERDEGGHRLTYWTTVPEARARTERAHGILENSELSGVAELVGDLVEWLSVFDARSLVELDYDGVCDLFTWDELDEDHSAHEIHEALEALGVGDLERSQDLYQRVAGRWAGARIHESLN